MKFLRRTHCTTLHFVRCECAHHTAPHSHRTALQCSAHKVQCSAATAAFVTSYARIFINTIKLEILKNGGSIYYSDTDSAKPRSLVLDKSYLNDNWIGVNIGQFKLKYDIK